VDQTVRAGGSYVFDGFRLDPARRELTHQGSVVDVTATALEALLHLVENAGDLVTKDDLMRAVWPDRHVVEHNLTQTIFVLRRALMAVDPNQRLIATAPRRGYRFVGKVLWQDGIPSSAQQASIAATVAEASVDRTPITRRNGALVRRSLILAVSAIVLVVVSAEVAKSIRTWRRPASPPAPSILVLTEPENLTGETVLDNTLGEALKMDLDQSPRFTVLSDQRIQDTLASMTRSRDAALTPLLALEVCTRNNGSAVLAGSVAFVHARYMLTLTATNCADDRVLAAEKTVVDRREDLIPALGELDKRLRRNLGESPSSIRRFNAPLLPEKTASLEALQAFSRATWLNEHGRRGEATPLFDRALAIDPNFAAAYEALSAIYGRMKEKRLEMANAGQAYALRDTVDERDRFRIVASFARSVTGNLPAVVRDAQGWAASYPNDPTPWAIVAQAEYAMRQVQPIMIAAERLLALAPNLEASYVLLARAHLIAGDWQRAKAICDAAVARGLAGEEIHDLLLRVALRTADRAAVAAQTTWAKGTSVEPVMLGRLGSVACEQGRIRHAGEIYAKVRALEGAEGQDDAHTTMWAQCLADVGLGARAGEILNSLPPSDLDYRYIYAAADAGDVGRAEALLMASLREHPADTLLVGDFAPETRSLIAVRRGDRSAAVADLVGASPYDRDIRYHRGEAYLANGDGTNAAREFLAFRAVIADSPENWYLSLSDLELARAYRLVGDFSTSRQYYRAFLQDWRYADRNLPLLKAAKAEYSKIQQHHSPSLLRQTSSHRVGTKRSEETQS
jgi:DNA-binding winged helix-turn-helix (wHTH) protein/tetratricopeptide (TPR) repeat protein